MGPSSSILRLPTEVRQFIAATRDGGATIDELVAAIEAEFGATISRSAMGRHVKKLDQVAAKMRESREIAEVMVRDLRDIADDRTGQLLVQMLHTMVFKQFRERISGDGEDFNPKEFAQYGRVLKDVASASAIGTKQAAEIRKAAREEAACDVEAAIAETGGKITQQEILERIRGAYGVA